MVGRVAEGSERNPTPNYQSYVVSGKGQNVEMDDGILILIFSLYLKKKKLSNLVSLRLRAREVVGGGRM